MMIEGIIIIMMIHFALTVACFQLARNFRLHLLDFLDLLKEKIHYFKSHETNAQ